MKKFLPLLLLFLWNTIKAQDFPDWAITQAEIDMKSYSGDPDARALILSEFGDARLTDEEVDVVSFKYHVKTKIFKSKGFDQGNVVIPLYFSDNNSFETVSDIEAMTSFTDERGVVQRHSLEKSQIFREKGSKHWSYVKFAMPNLREGCVIEYKYTIRSPFRFNLRKWDFQASVPKLFSEYMVHIPATYEYNVALIGSLSLDKNVGVVEKECYNMGQGKRADCSKIIYRINKVPAFIEEENMTAPSNFRSAITFELAQTISYTGTKNKITQEWKDIDLLLKKHEYFGDQIKKKDVFKAATELTIKNQTDDLSKARAVYSYIKGWYKWNNQQDMLSESIKKAYESHSGSIADINLSLAAALSAAGLSPETVILSTRENGFINKLYPTISNFNYVIVKLDINNKTYLLDASEPLLPFGLLPLRCINDQGRVISLNKPSYWIDMIASQKETKIYSADLSLKPNGKLNGTISRISVGYEAFNRRKRIKAFNTIEEFVEDYDEKWPKTKILKSEIANLDSLDNSLSEVYTVEIDAFDNLNEGKLYFNPFFLDRMVENPFKLESRSYPVDLGAIQDSRVILKITLPEKYAVTGHPNNLSLMLPNGTGRFISSTIAESNRFTFSEVKQLNKAIYTPEEYPGLKELFNKIVQLERTDIVIEKSK